MNKYSVIHASPSWKYNKHFSPALKYNPSGENEMRVFKKMTAEQIMGLPVGDLCEQDCCLFLWAPTPILQDAFKVVAGWGFSYKTLLTWEKTGNRHLGYWFKTCTEHLIVAVKGNVKSFGSTTRNCYHHRKLPGRRKPDFFYEIIEKVTIGKRVELFFDSPREGWDNYQFETLLIPATPE